MAAVLRSLPPSIWKQLNAVDYTECCHTVLPEAKANLDTDGSLCPGVNCCALCASPSSETVCEGCQYVRYCGPEHQAADAEVHGKVCSILHTYGTAATVPVEDDAVKTVVEDLIIKCTQGTSTLQSWSSLLDISEDASKSPEDSDGVNADSTEHGRMTEQLAVASSASSYLSGPLTLAHALVTIPELVSLVQSSKASGKPLRIAVLGADEAECTHWEAWQVVGAAAGCPLLLQLVGPEVPDALHLTTRHLASKVTLAFFMRTFEELVTGIERKWQALPEELTEEPQLLFGLNLGLTCPDYNWNHALAAAERIARRQGQGQEQEQQSTIAENETVDGQVPVQQTPQGLLLVSTTATLQEAEAETDDLVERGWTVVLEPESNPFLSLEVQQSGTMANDVYRKSSWLSAHRLQPRKATKRKSWGEWAKGVVDNLKELVSPSKRARAPVPTEQPPATAAEGPSPSSKPTSSKD